MIIVVDNTKNLSKAFMTPKLLECLDKKNIDYTVVENCDQIIDIMNNNNISGAILSGGPMSIAEEIKLSSINKNIMLLLGLDKPILGICFGLQIIGSCYGGSVDHMKMEKQENTVIQKVNKSVLFDGITTQEFTAFRYHKDYLSSVPPNFKVTSKSKDNIIQSIENKKLKRYAVQFHPEGMESSHKIIYNFLKLCE